MAEIPCPIRAATARHSEAEALRGPSRTLSYAALDEAVMEMATAFRQQHVVLGEIVAMTGPADLDYILAFLGLLRAGVVACPISPRFPKAYACALLEPLGCRFMIGGELGVPALRPLKLQPDRTLRDPEDAAPAGIPEDRPATVIFTSGSSGRPKAALHSFGNHWYNAKRSNENITLAPGDRWLLSLPLFHVAGVGVVFRCLLAGATVVIPAPGRPLADAIAGEDITHLSLVPTQLFRLLNDPAGRDALKRTKAILLGGSAVPKSLLRTAYDHGLPVCTSYGLTEMATQVTTTRPGDPLDRWLTSGWPLAPDTLRLSTDGEIQVKGDTLFRGYLEEGHCLRPLTEDGWFATGDLGRLDAQGYLTVTGRRDNMFIAGGENIQPEEIEAAICACSGVAEAIVVPVPHAEFGTTPAAFVRTESGAAPDAAALRGRLAEQLPRFKIPRYILAWPELPETGIKASRRLLAERAQALCKDAPET